MEAKDCQYRYVLGFLFKGDRNEAVTMITKVKPEWQAGLINGVGGKIELGEPPAHAMSREFSEETGAYVHPKQWVRVAKMVDPAKGVAIFVFAFSDPEGLFPVRTMTAETVIVLPVEFVLITNKKIPNLDWLIPLAKHAVSTIGWQPLDITGPLG